MIVHKIVRKEIPNLGQTLQRRQKELGIDVPVLCFRAGFSKQYWYQLASGKEETISENTLIKLCEILQLDIDTL